MAGGPPVSISLGDCDIRTALHRLRAHGRLRHALGGSAFVLRSAGVELPDFDVTEGERSETRVDRVRHVVGVDPGVALIGDVHDVAVGPDAARAVVAGVRQLLELLVADALKRGNLGIVGR